MGRFQGSTETWLRRAPWLLPAERADLALGGGWARVAIWPCTRSLSHSCRVERLRAAVHIHIQRPRARSWGTVLLTARRQAKIGDVGLARLVNHDYLSHQAAIGTFAWTVRHLTAPLSMLSARCLSIHSLSHAEPCSLQSVLASRSPAQTPLCKPGHEMHVGNFCAGPLCTS